MAQDLGYRPLVYFWIAEYYDGSGIAQFDPETGKENLFQVNPEKLVKIGWYPFTPELADKILKASGMVVVPTMNPIYAVELDPGDALIIKRENTLEWGLFTPDTARRTIYVLGKENGEVLRIKEDGTLE